MFEKLTRLVTVCALTGLVVLASGTAQANWEETFNANTFDLPTWEFYCYPDMAKTFTATIQDGPDDNDYLAVAETTSVGVMPPGSAFGGGFGSNEEFSDVRIGAVVNVTGDACRNYYVLSGRSDWFYDPTGTMPGNPLGAPGVVVSSYVLLVNWEDGPANLRLEIQKVIYLGNIMEIDSEVPVPGLNHARSYYAELDIVGSDPAYITGSLYEYKGGPLVARVPTLIDTNAQDPWEEPGLPAQAYPLFASGVSYIGGFNEEDAPAGYYCTFDDVFCISDGPAAVNPSPADGATGVPVDVSLSWVEAEFATSRELWLGKPGAMEKVDPAPTGTTYTPALEFGQTYEWRVDQVGPSGTVTGHTWSFAIIDHLLVDDFEDYDAGTNEIWWSWRDGLGYVDADAVFHPGNGTGSEVGDGSTASFTEETIVHGGGQSMPYLYDNNKADKAKYSEATKTLTQTRDWTEQGVKALSLWFRGNPPFLGGFTEAPAGTYTITAGGANIEDASDEFRFAYKVLNGAGTITAKVESVENTH
ncbi:MAG: hypothetical protein PVJ86_14845, partial [Phycisphaerales bacterium]